MLQNCQSLECLSLKIKATEHDEQPFASISFLLPKTIEIFELKQVLEDDAIFLVEKIGVSSSKDIDFSIPQPPLMCFCITVVVTSRRLYVRQATENHNQLPPLSARVAS